MPIPIGYLLILNSIYLINLENRESQMREKTLVFECLNKILKSILE